MKCNHLFNQLSQLALIKIKQNLQRIVVGRRKITSRHTYPFSYIHVNDKHERAVVVYYSLLLYKLITPVQTLLAVLGHQRALVSGCADRQQGGLYKQTCTLWIYFEEAWCSSWGS